MDPDWLTGIGTLVLAAATLILAGVTVWSVRSNNKANRLLREENKQLHERERNRMGKLQALEIISKWGDEVASIIAGEMFSLQSGGSLNDFLYKIHDITLDMESVNRASTLLEDWFQDLVTEALNRFGTFRKSILNLRDSYSENPETDKEQFKDQVIKNRIEVVNATFRLQRNVREHKVSLLI